MTAASSRKRAVATPGTTVRRTRGWLYRQAFAQIKKAQEQGFYLEAITLVESLITDRLESRLSHLKGKDFSFKTLGSLIEAISQCETDAEIKTLVRDELDPWRHERNRALHEMAKLAEGEESTWQERTERLAPTARRGSALLRKIDKHVSRQRRTST